MEQTVNILIDLTEPSNQELKITLDWKPNVKSFEFSLPIWTPGSYKVRDHVQYLYKLHLSQGEKTIETKRTATNMWSANLTTLERIKLSYTIEASDEEFIISSNTTGNFVLTRTFLSTHDNNLIPKAFTLHQNYPNPFNPTTRIQYDLPESKFVNIDIYDVIGRKIKSLVNIVQDAGYRSVYWDATNNLGQPVSAGMYIYTVNAGEFRTTSKMALIK